MGAHESGERSSARRPRWLKPAVLVLALLALLVIGRTTGAGEKLVGLRSWIASFGVWSPVVYAGVYAVLVTVAVPASPLTVLAGAMFGTVKGLLVVSVASTAGAGLSMLFARYLARDLIADRLAGNKRFRQLSALTESQGAIIVALTRLVPILPFALLNYAFGLTRVPFWTYLFWSWLCMLPITVVYVVGTDAIMQAVAHGTAPWALVAVFVVTAAIMALLIRSASRQLSARNRQQAP